MARVTLTVEQEHLARLAKLNDPVGAVEELIWNALDADAENVRVDVALNELGGVERVVITDDGTGMPGESCAGYFQPIGRSWKRTAQLSSRKQRPLHGKNGHGRVRAFALGHSVRWTTVADCTDGRRRTVIEAERSAMREFEIGPSGVVAEQTGTVFQAWGGDGTEGLSKLLDDRAVLLLTAAFAMHLEAYPDVEITFRGARLDPAVAQLHTADYELPDPSCQDGVPARLRVIEWRRPVPRQLALCDGSGIPLERVGPGIQAPGFQFTAYLSWPGFEVHPHDLQLLEWNPDSAAARLLAGAKDALRDHFRERVEGRRRELVQDWKAEGVYPYAGEPEGAPEQTERETFDTVAATVAGRLPRTKSAKRATLGLLSRLLACEPGQAYRALEQLFALNKQEREELDRLLNRTSLSAIIRTSTAVTNRLDFLKALELMVFDPEVNGQVRERAELHRILESETWVFGEEYALLASDQSLSTVLHRHLEVLRRPLPADTSVRQEDGRQGRVDLMLSMAGFPRDERHHLVVELKRPGVRLTLLEYAQLSGYANTVAQDDRFRDTGTSWDFWLVGNDMDDALRSQARQKHLPPGCASDSGNVRLWVRTWAEIIEECRRRLHFYRKELEYQSENEHAVDYLVRRHADTVARLVGTCALPGPRGGDRAGAVGGAGGAG